MALALANRNGFFLLILLAFAYREISLKIQTHPFLGRMMRIIGLEEFIRLDVSKSYCLYYSSLDYGSRALVQFNCPDEIYYDLHLLFLK